MIEMTTMSLMPCSTSAHGLTIGLADEKLARHYLMYMHACTAKGGQACMCGRAWTQLRLQNT